MKTLIKTITAGFVATLAMTSQASALCILNIICLGGGGGNGGGGGGGGGIPEAPEINVAQGLAAVAILICAALFLRERFLRRN